VTTANQLSIHSSSDGREYRENRPNHAAPKIQRILRIGENMQNARNSIEIGVFSHICARFCGLIRENTIRLRAATTIAAKRTDRGSERTTGVPLDNTPHDGVRRPVRVQPMVTMIWFVTRARGA
jgi:hypothetical protein